MGFSDPFYENAALFLLLTAFAMIVQKMLHKALGSDPILSFMTFKTMLFGGWNWVTQRKKELILFSSYSKRRKYLPFTIAAPGGCERAGKEFCRFAARIITLIH